MAKYRVYLERSITGWAEVEVEAADDQEAADIAWEMADAGDVDFEPHYVDPDLEIMSVDLVDEEAD